MPTSRIAAISSAVATGRSMKMRDGFTEDAPPGGAALPASGAEGGALVTVTFAPSCSRSKRCSARTSPGVDPSTWVKPASVTPGLTFRTCATPS